MNSHRIFLPGTRSRLGPAQHIESRYEYLDSSAEAHVVAVRALLNDWFSRYPAEEQSRLVATLRSKDDRQFHSGFWELYIHESLLKDGFTVKCHPKLSSHATQPDFRVTRSGNPFYIEARLVGPSNSEVSSARREAAILDALDRVDSDLFFLDVTLLIPGSTNPSGRGIRSMVNAWLRTLDADHVVRLAKKNPAELPQRDFCFADWKYAITANPVRPDRRGMRRRAVGIYGSGEMTRVDTTSAIRDRLHKKAGRYDGLDGPLILALLVHESPFADERHVTDALFGTECVRYQLDPRRGITSAEPGRKRDGVWTTPLDRSGKLIPGVLVGIKIDPWNVNKRAPIYWRNPHTPEVADSLPWDVRAIAANGYLESLGDFSPSTFFDLPTTWPEAP